MEQKEKELLLKDLCARLPYEVIINVHDTFPCTTLPYFNIHLTSFVSIISSIEPIFKTKDKLIKKILKEHTEYLEFKPYLRPISSMSEEEEEEFVSFTDTMFRYGKDNDLCCLPLDTISWLNAHHFDYRGLIKKGLALEAPDGMYEKKKA